MSFEERPPSSHLKLPIRRNGIPLGFEHLLNPLDQQQDHVGYAPTNMPASPLSPSSSRLRLHIRQQPVIARACSAGEKDRRTIDPPPILQLLLVNFNPDSETDQVMLQNMGYTVGCLLYSVERSGPGGKEKLVHSSQVMETFKKRRRDEESSINQGGYFSHSVAAVATSIPNFDEQSILQRPVQILSGKTFVSPFHVPYDPDPETAPKHPSSDYSHSYGQHHNHNHFRHLMSVPETSQKPATFFIFSDLSVRTTGTYRLRFRLMDWGATLNTGVTQPILADVLSEPFDVYSSKEFPGMKASSALTWNLRKMGMSELKPREGKGKGVLRKKETKRR